MQKDKENGVLKPADGLCEGTHQTQSESCNPRKLNKRCFQCSCHPGIHPSGASLLPTPCFSEEYWDWVSLHLAMLSFSLGSRKFLLSWQFLATLSQLLQTFGSGVKSWLSICSDKLVRSAAPRALLEHNLGLFWKAWFPWSTRWTMTQEQVSSVVDV